MVTARGFSVFVHTLFMLHRGASDAEWLRNSTMLSDHAQKMKIKRMTDCNFSPCELTCMYGLPEVAYREYDDFLDSIGYFEKQVKREFFLTGNTGEQGTHRDLKYYPRLYDWGYRARYDIFDKCSAPSERKEIADGLEEIDAAPVKAMTEQNITELLDKFENQKGFKSNETGNKTNGMCWRESNYKICGTCFTLPVYSHSWLDVWHDVLQSSAEPVCFTAVFTRKTFIVQLVVAGSIVAENKIHIPDFVSKIEDIERKLTPGQYFPLRGTKPTGGGSWNYKRCHDDRYSGKYHSVNTIVCYQMKMKVNLRLRQDDPKKFDLDFYSCSEKDVQLRYMEAHKIHQYNITCFWIKTGLMKTPNRSGSNETIFLWDEAREPNITFQNGEEETDTPIQGMEMKNVDEIAPSLIPKIDEIEKRIARAQLSYIPQPVTKGTPTEPINWAAVRLKSLSFMAILYASPMPTRLTKESIHQYPGYQPILDYFSDYIAKASSKNGTKNDTKASPVAGDACGGVFIASDKVLTICACIRFFYAFHKHSVTEIPNENSVFDIISPIIYITSFDRGFTVDSTEFQLETDTSSFNEESTCFQAINKKAGVNILQTTVVTMTFQPHLGSFKPIPIVSWFDEVQGARSTLRPEINVEMGVMGLKTRSRTMPIFDSFGQVLNVNQIVATVFFENCPKTFYCTRIPSKSFIRIPKTQSTQCFWARKVLYELCGGVIGFPLVTRKGVFGLNAKPIKCLHQGSILAALIDKNEVGNRKRNLTSPSPSPSPQDHDGARKFDNRSVVTSTEPTPALTATTPELTASKAIVIISSILTHHFRKQREVLTVKNTVSYI